VFEKLQFGLVFAHSDPLVVKIGVHIEWKEDAYTCNAAQELDSDDKRGLRMVLDVEGILRADSWSARTGYSVRRIGGVPLFGKL